jgi:zinc transporter ZupT
MLVGGDAQATKDLITGLSIEEDEEVQSKLIKLQHNVLDIEMEAFRKQEEAKNGCCQGMNLTSFVLLIALSTHALFEGIALGLTKDLSASVNIMLGLLIHKTAASMSLGISISKNFEDDEQRKGMILLFSFAMATPIGIAVGLMLQDTNDMVEIVFSAFAAGTFIYIAASEVIVEEFSIPGRKKWLQMIMFILGCTLITCMWFLESD